MTTIKHDKAEIARKLSKSALHYLLSRRLSPLSYSSSSSRAERYTKIINQIDELTSLLGEDPADIFPPDIGHAPAVVKCMGLSIDAAKENWTVASDAAQCAKNAIGIELPEILGILRAATVHTRDEMENNRRQGRRTDNNRHIFSLSILLVYEELTERSAGISREAHGTRKHGPTPRFLATVCSRLRDRLTDEERSSDPDLSHDLSKAADMSAAPAWVEEALKWGASTASPLYGKLRRKK